MSKLSVDGFWVLRDHLDAQKSNFKILLFIIGFAGDPPHALREDVHPPFAEGRCTSSREGRMYILPSGEDVHSPLADYDGGGSKPENCSHFTTKLLDGPLKPTQRTLCEERIYIFPPRRMYNFT